MDETKEKKKTKGGKREERKEPIGNTEKHLFERQIEKLKQRLEECDAKLRQRRESLDRVRSRLDTETDSEQACVSYLKRVLAFETDRRMEVQEKLQTLRDQAELIERRALGKFAVSEKTREAAKSQFLQQKLELEGRLSLLEELRLQRNSQLAHLKKVEEALEEKISALRERSREEDLRQVDALLKSKEQFLEKCRRVRGEWQEAFRLRMPVHAKKQLEENVRLREICDKATEKLLQVQDQNRHLKMLQKSFELEEEIQTSAEEDTDRRKALREKLLQQLLLTYQELLADNAQESFFINKDIDETKKNISGCMLQLNNKLQEVATSKDNVKRKTKTDECSLQQEVFTYEDAVKRETETNKCIVEKSEQDISITEDETKQEIENDKRFLEEDNKQHEASVSDDAIIRKTEEDKRILEEYNKQHEAFMFDDAVIRNTEVDNLNQEQDNKFWTSEDILTKEIGGRIPEQSDMQQEVSMPEDEAKGETEKDKQILEEDYEKRDLSLPDDEVIQKTETDNPILEQDNRVQGLWTYEDSLKQEAERDGRIPEQKDMQQEVSTSQDEAKWKTEEDKQILEEDNKQHEASMSDDAVIRKTETDNSILDQSKRGLWTSEDTLKKKKEIDGRIPGQNDEQQKVSMPENESTEKYKQILLEDNKQHDLPLSEDAMKWEDETDNPNLKQDNTLKRETEIDERISEQDERQEVPSTPEDVAKQKIQTIAESEAEQCRLVDKCNEVMIILRDQAVYKQSLEKELEQSTDENGLLMSTLLRAGQIFEARCGKLHEERQGALDFDLLQQMRFLLDLASNED